MISFPRILFPVDLSEQSRKAAPFVKSMAKRFHADVTLLHVVEIPPSWHAATGAVTFSAWIDLPELMGARQSELSTYLAEELGDVVVQPCIQSGDPAAIIDRVARQKQISLIMMPTHGYGPVRSVLLGSVTAKVLHDTACPVWTAAHADKMEPGRKWHRILCAIGSDAGGDVSLLHWAAQFAAEQRVSLTLVHAVSGFDEDKSYYPQDPLREFLFGVARDRLAKLQEEAGTKYEVNIEAGSAGDVIRKLALDQNADLIVAGRGVIQKPLGRFLSNTYAIVREGPCPVISLWGGQNPPPLVKSGQPLNLATD